MIASGAELGLGWTAEGGCPYVGLAECEIHVQGRGWAKFKVKNKVKGGGRGRPPYTNLGQHLF